MIYPPHFVIYLAVQNYLTEGQVNNLQQDLGKRSIRNDKMFLEIIRKHFDIELFRTKPFIWQDIWLYNYLMYDIKRHRLNRQGLIAKYEKEIIIPQKKALDELKDIMLILNK